MLSELLKSHYLEIPNQLFSYLEEFVNENDIKKLSMNVFGFSSKRSLKIIRNLVNDNHIKYSFLHLIKVLSNDKSFNKDLILNTFELIDISKENFNIHHINKTNINLLEKYFNERQIINIITEKPELVTDIFLMLKRVLENNIELTKIKEHKKTLELHDYLTMLCSRIKNDFDLEQRPDVVILEGKKIIDNLTIVVPRTHLDLVKLGQKLNFCIGNGNYSKQVKNKQCSIISVCENDNPKYGVQFTRYSVLQAKGLGNSNLPKNVLYALENLLTEKPELPTDFLEITDSSFIDGYKYNNKDLYLSMKGKVYIYIDVPHNVYEELIASDRKGAYLNSHIKNRYEYQRLS